MVGKPAGGAEGGVVEHGGVEADEPFAHAVVDVGQVGVAEEVGGEVFVEEEGHVWRGLFVWGGMDGDPIS